MPNFVFGFQEAVIIRAHFRRYNITLPPVRAGVTTVLQQAASMPRNVPSIPVSEMLFKAASVSSADLANLQTMHLLYDSMFRQIVEAVEFGVNVYRRTAGLFDVVINGPIATGGRFNGPKLDELIIGAPSVRSWTRPKAVMRDAVAKGIHRQWLKAAATIKVPGMSWYPVFAAFPGPVAPPIPNVPTPLRGIIPDTTAITPVAIKQSIQSFLHEPFDYSGQFLESIANGFSPALQVWLNQQKVAQVMGSGPVPTFAPPFVCVGPVINGKILPGSHINS